MKLEPKGSRPSNVEAEALEAEGVPEGPADRSGRPFDEVGIQELEAEESRGTPSVPAAKMGWHGGIDAIGMSSRRHTTDRVSG